MAIDNTVNEACITKIAIIYDIDGNPYYGDNVANKVDWLSEYTRPTEVNDLLKIFNAIGYDTEVIDGPKELLTVANEINQECVIVFNLSRGLSSGLGKKGITPAICEYIGVRYIGATAYGLTLGRNKYHCNCIIKASGIPVPISYEISLEDDFDYSRLLFPIIIKPSFESNSIGIDESSVFYDIDGVNDHVTLIQETYDQSVIIEQYISGLEISVAVIGNGEGARAIGHVVNLVDGKPVKDIVISRAHNAERRMGTSPVINQELRKKLSVHACTAHRELYARDYSRTDFRLNQNGDPVFIELEHQPDLGLDSTFVPAGLQTYNSPKNIIEAIIIEASKRTS